MKTPGVTEEIHFKSSSGYAAIVFAILALLMVPGGVLLLKLVPVSVAALLLFLFLVKGVYMLQPNQSALLMLFGTTAARITPRACAGRIPS